MACSSSCSGSAGAGCSTCGGTCSGNCSGCTGNCSGSCSGGCSANCSSNCSGKCNSKCTDGASIAVENLNLIDIYTASNIQTISDAIYYEAGPNRRKQSPVSLSFSIGETITNEKMLILINNLIKAGQSITAEEYSVAVGQKALKTFGNALISKVKTAYEQVIEG